MLSNKALLVTLSIGQPKLRTTDREVTREVNTNHSVKDGMAKTTKRLFCPDDYRGITELINEIRHQHHYKRTLPWLDAGQRILPSSAFLDYAERMRAYREKFDRLVDDFCGTYATRLSNARLALNGMFRAEDYPTVGEIRERFRLDVSYSPVPVSGDFRAEGIDEAEKAILSAELMRRECEAMQVAAKALAERIVEVVSGLKNKVGQQSLDNAEELVALLPSLNLTGDPEIARVTDQLKRMVASGKTIDTNGQSRAEKAVKADINQQASEIVDRMAGLFSF